MGVGVRRQILQVLLPSERNMTEKLREAGMGEP